MIDMMTTSLHFVHFDFFFFIVPPILTHVLYIKDRTNFTMLKEKEKKLKKLNFSLNI